jgi:hypothetical protein
VPAKSTRPMMSHMRWLALHPIRSISVGGPPEPAEEPA